MKTTETVLSIRGNGVTTEHVVPVESFSTLAEARKVLGKVEMLKLLNYAHRLTQLSNARRILAANRSPRQ